MKKLILIAFSLATLAACAPVPERDPATTNAARAFVATEAAKNCPRHLALNRGESYNQAMALNNSLLGGRAATLRQEAAERMSRDGFCERSRNNLLSNPQVNPYLRAI